VSFDALVLAGGSARRMGGEDKPALLVGGQSLLDRVLGAVASASVTVVVGPQRATSRPVLWAREDPPGGGPAAALAAGLLLVEAPWVAVLAADLPFLTPAVVDLLLAAAQGSDGAVLLDDTGRDQVLTGVWRTAALREAAAGDLAGAPLRRVLGGLTCARVTAPAGGPAPWADCDTPAELAAAWGRA
jgi:molybdopterin-guanine dinucleotide biosynthesis protein A